MAENKFKANSRDPRYSSSRALGFRGGAATSDGNVSAPSATSVSGSADRSYAAAPAANATPAIARASTASIPRPPSAIQSLGMTVGAKVVGDYAKKGIDAAANSIRNSGFGPENNYGGDDLASGADYPVTSAEYMGANAAGGIADTSSDVLSSAGGNLGDAIDGSSALADGADGMGAFGDAMSEGVGEGIDAVSGFDASGVPIVGPLVRLASGDVEGAVGSAVGGAVGSVFGPIGTAVGSWIGSKIADKCFITEAVMSQEGMGDNSEPLEVLRAFRDNVMMQTPEGQAMVQEYEQIAPLIVEAIGQRPDAMKIYQQIKAEFIDPAVEMIKKGDNKGALEIYAKMVAFAASFSEEVMQGDAAAMEGIGQLGDHAAMVSHDDDMTSMVGGQGVGDTDWQQMDPEMQQQPMQQPMPAIAQMSAGPRRF